MHWSMLRKLTGYMMNVEGLRGFPTSLEQRNPCEEIRALSYRQSVGITIASNEHTQGLVMRAHEHPHGHGSSILGRFIVLRLREVANLAVEFKDSLI